MSDIHHQNRSVSSLEGSLRRGQEAANAVERLSVNVSNMRISTLGDLDHRDRVSCNIGALFMKEDISDVTLILGKERIPCHRVILASCSQYFRALLYGGLKETHEKEVEIKDVDSVESFKLLLEYFYTGRMSLNSLKEEVILEILGLTHKFGFQDLEEAIVEYFLKILSISNVCLLYDASLLYGLTLLAKECLSYIDKNATDVMNHESFFMLSPSSLKEMIQRDSFCAQEIDVFKAVQEWIRRNPEEKDSIPEILACVRLPLIELEQLMEIVRPCDFVTADVILDAVKSKCDAKDRPQDLGYRGFMLPEENVACAKHGAKVEKGEQGYYLLSGDNHNYDLDKGFTRHAIEDGQVTGIVIKLGMQCIINHIRMLLWDKDSRAYSFYIEVSMDEKEENLDKKKWTRIIDHQNYNCRSWQNLYFNQCVAKYINIVGTKNTANKVFHAVSFECMYTEKPFEIHRESGLLIPDFNVASISNSACVIEGVSRSRNALINGDWENYDWDTGYTCHQVGSGAIVIQLPQPYWIDSMRLLLWDIDSRTYSYYVEVSIDQSNWHLVHDRREGSCRSWQLINFPGRAVVFIRIIGTYNTANEVFHCVHFECPAQLPVEGQAPPAVLPPDDKDDSQDQKGKSSSQASDRAKRVLELSDLSC